MSRSPGRARLLGVGVALLAALAVPAAAAVAAGPKAKIIRSAHGIPTIKAKDYEGLGFGYGYAFAADNICTVAEAYVTANGERSRYFGADGTAPGRYSNLDSDFFFGRIRERGTVEELIAQKPPLGPKNSVKQAVKGYVAGYNHYLAKTGVENLPDPRCAGEPWVQKIDKMDVYRRFYQLAEIASGYPALDGIATAEPPPPARAQAGAAPAPELPSEAEVRELGEALEAGDGLGSNGWGLGSQATENRSGMVLANPHFPWQGSERLYQSHLVINGKLNVSGASLFGVPAILIGHTDGLAWTHTVSTAYRFTPIELEIAPGDPTSYVVDGQTRKMETDQVTVQTLQPDGSLAPVTRTLYTTEYGPMFDTLQGRDLFGWTAGTGYALFDANAENMRLLNHFFDTNRAQSTKQLYEVLRKYQGVPWVNTMAADSKGKAFYADIGSIPNVPNSKATGCAGALGALTFPALGLPTLDGSRSECAPGTDPDSVVPGIFGPSNEPHQFRRDYVANANDSHWLTNPEQPLEGFARIIGAEQTERSLRTRLGLKMIEGRLAGTDGLQGDRFTRNQLRRLAFQNRHYGGELLRDQLAAFCRANPMLTGSAGPVDVSAACPALEAWDVRVNLDSTGALLFLRFLDNLGPIPFTTPFDLADPVNTPYGLDTSNPAVGTALADAVSDLGEANIALDAPYGEYHYVVRNGERIPIHGGPGPQGVFNVITSSFEPGVGWDEVVHGSSFVMVTSFGKDGKGCPKDRSILTYSLSDNPESPFFADQTEMYSQKQWVNPPFCPDQVRRAAESVKVVRGG